MTAADRIVALTGDERDLIGRYGLDDGERVRVVGNGIDDSAMARSAAARRAPRNTVTVLYSGGSSTGKGFASYGRRTGGAGGG